MTETHRQRGDADEAQALDHPDDVSSLATEVIDLTEAPPIVPAPVSGRPVGNRLLGAAADDSVVRFENVGMRYGLGEEVLSDLSFAIAPHSLVVDRSASITDPDYAASLATTRRRRRGWRSTSPATHRDRRRPRRRRPR